MTTEALPVIDLRLVNGLGRANLAKKLADALQNFGFFYVEGIDGYDEDELLKYTRWFFDLPESARMGIARKHFNPNSEVRFRGYFPVDKNDSSHKEGYDLGSLEPLMESHEHEKHANIFYEETPWPEVEDPEELDRFKEFSRRFYNLMTSAGLTLLELAAEGCSAPSNLLVELFRPDPVSCLRYLHYPPREEGAPKTAYDPQDGALLLCGAHNDSGFLTMLSTFSYAGLQLKREDGSWMSVPVRPGSVVVNTGDMLARMSGGRWRATNHRVIDLGVDRYSVPFFLEPKYSADMAVRLPCADEQRGEPVWFGPWSLLKQAKIYYEFQGLPYPESMAA